MATVVRVVLAAFLGFVLIVGLGVLLLWVDLSGGWDDAFRFDRPEDGDPEVVAAQEAVQGPFIEASRARTDNVVVPSLGMGATPRGSGVVRPSCLVGQHNWKVDDNFDLSCELHAIEVVAMADHVGFRADMEALDVALEADGWQPSQEWSMPMERVLADYWDDYVDTEERPVDRLPSAQYERVVGEVTERLEVSWFRRGSDPNAITYYEEWGEFHTGDGEPTSPRGLMATVSEGGYGVVLTTTVVFFHE